MFRLLLAAILRISLRALVACAVASLFAVSAQALSIDAFDSGDAFVLENVGSGAELTQDANVLGGVRDILSVFAKAVFEPSLGIDLIVTPPSSAAGINLFYQAGGVNLSPNGEEWFRVTLENIPPQLGGPFLTVVIVTDGGQRSWSSTDSIPSSGPLVIELPFDPAEVANVQDVLIEVKLFADPGRSILLTDFRTVIPEPSTALLLASGLLGLAVRGRRRTH